ncbi:four-carbon acid sugar kinase family protein [Streptomyces sp. B6B3]|uniref:four-carbon acid sugar kinase family protein n=1 Tax=Streptomyces sp. B6B3 TaxID=3153570 RepID=UPI00325DB917
MRSATQVLVVADDLTGANATAAGFARAGLRAVTAGAPPPPGPGGLGGARIPSTGPDAAVLADFVARFDAVVVNTDARHLPPDAAGERVTAAIRAAWPVALVCNRVDSTLRGNVGATTAAALRAVRGLHEASGQDGRRAVVLCSPAHPAAGRHTVQGRQLLNGVRLEDTELAHDPRSPVPTSDIARLLAAQAPGLRTAPVPLSAVTGDPGALRALLGRLLERGVDVIVADALTADHLDRTAAAAVAAGGDRVDWLAVDPGPGSVALARALGLIEHAETGPVLAVSGSTTRLTRLQLARLRAEHQVRVVRPKVSGLRDAVPDVEATAAALEGALAAATPGGGTVLVATVLEEIDVVDGGPEHADRLPVALAQAVRRALERHAVSGLFATGGDVATALLAELGAHGLDIEGEVAPLAVAGTLVGGAWSGLPVVTKGGLVGDADTTADCVARLRRMAAARRRRVRTALQDEPAAVPQDGSAAVPQDGPVADSQGGPATVPGAARPAGSSGAPAGGPPGPPEATQRHPNTDPQTPRSTP